MTHERRRRTARMAVRILIAMAVAVAALGGLWWALFALKPYAIDPSALHARYAHDAPGTRAGPVELDPPQAVRVGQVQAWAHGLRFRSFDGEQVRGRLVVPATAGAPAPARAGPPRRRVLLALHAMGRTQWRWWQGEFKGRPTIENTHVLAERALQAGHVVIALDARGHGDRKDPRRPVTARQLLRDLHLWGQREPYERLIVDTVKDYRVLLDWVARQPGLDGTRVRAAGYSMGAQMALLLAAADTRVHGVAAMVPPHLDAKVAAVAPTTVAPRLADVEVWLLTADDDEHASTRQNDALFRALPGEAKRHLRFEGGHVLPAGYVDRLQPWLSAGSPGR